MIRFPLWKMMLVIGLCVLAMLYAAPNLLGKAERDAWQAKVPAWVPSRAVNLGLDLQGGSHILLEVGIDTVYRDQSDNLVQALRGDLREAKIPYSSLRAQPRGFVVTIRDEPQLEAARQLIRKLDPDLLIENGTTGAGSLQVTFSDVKLKTLADHALNQSIEIVRRRVDETGTREPIIQRQGDNRIVVQVPGLDNPERIKALLGKTAKLGFHLVDAEASQTGRSGVNVDMLPMQENPTQKLAVSKRAMISGDMLTNAQPSFRDGLPVVTFQFDATGTRRFCDVSREQVGKPFAIVLDGLIISAPVIREPICGGSGEISGGFTVEQTYDLALLLRAGALPAPLKIVEERSIGPSLGSDSVAHGQDALVAALVLVVAFMVISYGLMGAFASVALVLNLVLMIALMSMLGATLTLPGIAGIVLTVGMAVDGNVLIYERMREELRAGRSLISAIDTGYSKAMGTITDSNVTALIASFLLYAFGTGPIKGFAVTLTIGIITSMFASIMITRLMVVLWLRWAKPKTLPI